MRTRVFIDEDGGEHLVLVKERTAADVRELQARVEGLSGCVRELEAVNVRRAVEATEGGQQAALAVLLSNYQALAREVDALQGLAARLEGLMTWLQRLEEGNLALAEVVRRLRNWEEE